MRIVLLMVPDYPYANYMAKRFLNEYANHVVAIFESRTAWREYGVLKTSLYLALQTSVRYLWVQIIKTVFVYIGTFLHRFFRVKAEVESIFYPYTRDVEKLNIPLIPDPDINSDKTRTLLKAYEPDLLISVQYNQIVSEQTLGIAKLGGINLHMSYLPSYRGLKAIFWSLVNQEKETGVTIHRMDKGIDTGEIIARRRVAILPEDSEHRVYCRSTRAMTSLLNQMTYLLIRGNDLTQIKSLLAEQAPEVTSNDVSQAPKESYYSMPTREAVSKFYSLGRSFFSFRELMESFYSDVR